MKKIIMLGLIGLFCAVGAQAVLHQTVAAGNWEDSATWNQPTYPGGTAGQADEIYLYAGAVTANSALPGEVAGMTMWGAGQLILNAGAYQTHIGNLAINNGNSVTLNSGAEIFQPAAGLGYLYVGNEAGGASTLNIAGGTYNSERASFMNTAAGNVASLNVTDGLFTSTWQLIFGGGANSVGNVNLTGGTMALPWIDFNDANNGQTETITIDGGALVLTEPTNPYGSLDFTGDWQKVFFEDGTMVWEGVNTVEDFNLFTDSFNGWVDSGNLTSANWTAAELKASLSFNGVDAVAAIPEPATLGLVAIFGGALLCMRRLKI